MNVKELKERIGIENVISMYSMLIPISGKRYKCLCPFHEDKDPSLIVYVDTQSFCCFGCGFKGDMIDFLMRIQNKSFKEVVKILRDYYRQVEAESHGRK